jgi:carbon storage regulator
MLVLSRKAGESIKIGDDITIKVIEIRHDQVRIGIEAPKDISILRSELKDQSPPGDTPSPQ